MARKNSLENNHTKTAYFGMFEYLVLLSFVFAYLPTWNSLIMVWIHSEDYSHGFFIIPIVMYILWHKRIILRKLPQKSSYCGLIILIGSLFIYLIAFFAEIKTIESLTIISTLTGLVLYIYGYPILKETSFPLLYIIFMIPIPEQLYTTFTIQLQIFVSKVSVNLASLIGIPIFREGNIIQLAGQSLEVVRSCSGMRSIVTLLSLAAIIAYFTINSNLLRTILIISSIPAAIIVNILRVIFLILGFYYIGVDFTLQPFHKIIGIVIFFIAITLIFFTKRVLSLWDDPTIEN